jgi:hypothetical protein
MRLSLLALLDGTPRIAGNHLLIVYGNGWMVELLKVRQKSREGKVNERTYPKERGLKLNTVD